MSEHVQVTVCQGKLRGVVEKNWTGCGTFVAFRGIPYAKPPIGELRFKDPEPAEPWTGVRDASQFCDMPPQFDYYMSKSVGNEDCLYLNVYTKEIDLQTKRPVMVFIHGGGFHCCSANSNYFGPDNIVAKDVVLVTINFRLGALGFLNLDDEWAPGNQGLKDALMALRWIHDNISNFGGDPENVTIFGHDTGGSMAHYLAVCPQAAGLFHKVISQSGTAAIPLAFSEKETQKVRSFLLVEILGKRIRDPKDAVKFLKSMDASDIVEASLDILWERKDQQLIFPFVPTVDCDSPNPFFVEHPAIMLSRGVKVPFIVGCTSYEGSVFTKGIDEEDLEHVNSDFASFIHPSLWPMLMRKSLTGADVYCRYFGDKPVSMKNIANYIYFLGDMHFYRGIFETICIQAQLGLPSTYIYMFSHDPKRSLPKLLLNIQFPGATHGEELPYIFYPRMSEDLISKLDFNVSDEEKSVITERITQMWTDFAKTGNPTPATTPLIPVKWTPIEWEDKFQILIMDKHFWIETVEKEKLRFFELL